MEYKKKIFEIGKTKNLQKLFKIYQSVSFHQQRKRSQHQNKSKMQLMNPFYILLFCVLVVQVCIFILVSFLPKQLLKSFVEWFTKISQQEIFWKFHIVFCLILVIFFFDLHSTQINFEQQKTNLQMIGGYMATELRRGYLSYSVLKVQRNKYIVFTLFFTSIVTTAYLRLLNFYYKTEETLVYKKKQGTKIKIQQKDLNETTQITPEQKSQYASTQNTNKCKQD